MAILSVKEVGNGLRRGRFTDTFQRESVRTFRVRTTSNLDDVDTVCVAADPLTGLAIPAMWDFHPTDTGRQVRDVSGQETNDPRCWLVSVVYSTRATDQAQQNISPTAEIPQYTVDNERVEEAMGKDLDGLTIKNAAGEPFDPPPVEEKGILVVNYQDNVDSFPVGEPLKFLYCANATEFWGQPRKTVLITKYTSGPRSYRNGVSYFPRYLQFKIDPTGDWTKLTQLNCGFQQLINGRLRPATTEGVMPSRPVLLDVNGRIFPDPTALPSYSFVEIATDFARQMITVDYNSISTAPTLQTGDQVTISGVTDGIGKEANGTWIVSWVSATKITLNNATVTGLGGVSASNPAGLMVKNNVPVYLNFRHRYTVDFNLLNVRPGFNPFIGF